MNVRVPILALFLSLLVAVPARAASQTPDDLFKAGVVTLKGDGVPQNTPKAMKLLEKSAKQGNPRAQVWVAVIRDHSPKNGDQKAAFKWAKMAADQGHPVGQFLVGSHYMSGQAVDKDLQQAEDWLTRAANQGQRDAMMNLSILSAQDIGSTPGPAWSYYWTTLAANQGLSYAVSTLKRLQELPDEVKELGEKRAKAFNPKLERPELYTTDDLKIPNTRAVVAAVPGASPVPGESPVPAPTAAPAAPPTKKKST